MRAFRRCGALSVALFAALGVCAQQSAPKDLPKDELNPNFKAPERPRDYEKRVVMVPMRDGVKLYTVIVIPKGAHDAPIVLTRTPYNAAARAERTKGATKMIDLLPLSDEDFVTHGYIRVYQDVRGKYGSEGVYLMTPPPVDSDWNPSGADDTMDAYDTIDWLVKNVPESNGRVGMIGSSYEGFTVVMALLHPHPALKVAAPESPMVDGWMGDDWFHYGAFRQPSVDYFTEQMTKRGLGAHIEREHRDDYTNFLEAGSLGDFARAGGLDQLPFWHIMEQHPAYDGFWQSQALDKLIAKVPLTVPTMWEQGEWDQEDMYGGNHAYRAWEPKDTTNSMNFLVMGPWFHSQINRQGLGLGPFEWASDTALYWRHDILVPFFNQYLKPGSPKADTPPVLMYDAGLDHWDRLQAFPVSCEHGCAVPARPLYLTAGGGLSFEIPKKEAARFDEYVSNPAKPVPDRPRPIDQADNTGWRTWLVDDQRFVDGRPDVLTYVSEPLTKSMKLSGEPIVHLIASTSGSDSDWVVKLIDVYPESEVKPGDVGGVYPDVLGKEYNMSGYELPIGIDIFRGRYRTSFEHPSALEPNKPLEFTFALPLVERTILPGHRLMVQVQSTLFPLYDRNPQKFVPNILDAKSADYEKATQKIWHEPGEASYISLPVVPANE